jgi:RNA chaperone Hfq
VFALVTGQFIEGRIQRFDQYSVLVDADGKTLLIFKSAISDISLPLGPP